MARRMEVCCVALFVMAALLSTATAVDFVRGPGSVVVPIGGAALLKCTVDLNTAVGTATLYWYKARDGGGTYITGGTTVYSRNPGWERYSVESSRVNGMYSYNLKIVDVAASDAGQYQCMGIDRSGSKRSPIGSLGVLPETGGEPLTCNFYPESPTVGQAVTFSCMAPAGISPEMLSWWMGGGIRVQPSAHLSNNHGISFVKTLGDADNFAEFTCLVGSSFDAAGGLNCSVTPLAVPIRAVITPSTAVAVVAGSATYRCRGTALPPVTRYRWIYGSGTNTVKISESKRRFTVTNNGDSSTLTIAGLTMADNNKIVRCVVLNEVTKTIGSAELQVTTHIGTMQTSPSQSPSPITKVDGPTPSAAKTPRKTTGRVTSEATATTQGNSDVITLATTQVNSDAIKLFGCAKDCGEKISPQQDPNSGNSALAAALSVLGICGLVAAIIIYIAYNRRGRSSGRVIKKKMKNKPLQRLNRSLRSSANNSEQDLVRPNSVRLKTIEVIVNPPPPEWRLRVKDLAVQGPDDKVPDAPDPATGPAPDGDARLDCDALYAKPDKTSKRGRQGDAAIQDGAIHAVAPPAAGAPSPARAGQFLSAETDDCFPDGVSDASTWDMSSVDSGCEEEGPETDDPRHDDNAYAELDLTTPGRKSNTFADAQTETTEYANTIANAATLPRT